MLDPADRYEKDAEAFLKRFRLFANVNFGDRCPDFDDGCYTCKLWALYDQVSAVVEGNEPGGHEKIVELQKSE